MKDKAKKYLKDNFPHTNEELLHRHPLWHDCVIDAMAEFARNHAIGFLNYCSCVEDFTDPNGLDKENIKIHDTYVDQLS